MLYIMLYIKYTYFATLNSTVPDKDIYYPRYYICHILPKTVYMIRQLKQNLGRKKKKKRYLHRSPLKNKEEEDYR